MILTVCANPCIDYTLYINNFKESKLNRVIKKVESLGGKAINVAIAVKRLGYDSYSTGFMFDDSFRKYSEKLDNEGVPFSYTVCEGLVRVNNKIISLPFMDLTEINESGNPVSYSKQYELIENIRTLSKNASFVVFSGSLPPDIEDDFYYRAAKSVDSGCKIVIDSEGERLINALKVKPELVKPNLFELENATGKKTETNKDILNAADILLKAGAKCVIVSSGKDGAIIYDGKEAFLAKAPRVEIKGMVGAGDSMVGAACIAMEMGCCKEAIIKSAVAAGTAAILKEGMGLLTKKDYDDIFPLVETVKIL